MHWHWDIFRIELVKIRFCIIQFMNRCSMTLPVMSRILWILASTASLHYAKEKTPICAPYSRSAISVGHCQGLRLFINNANIFMQICFKDMIKAWRKLMNELRNKELLTSACNLMKCIIGFCLLERKVWYYIDLFSFFYIQYKQRLL